MANLEDDFYDDIVEFIASRAQSDIVYDNLDYMVAGDRNNYDTRMMKNIVSNTMNMYNFFLNEYYRNKSERECYNLAIEFICETTAAQEVFRSRNIMNRLSQGEIDDLDELIQDSKQVITAYERYARSMDRRGGSSNNRGITRDQRNTNSRYDHRQQDSRYGSGRYANNNTRRQNTSIFDDDPPSQNQVEASSSARARAVASRNYEQPQRRTPVDTRHVPQGRSTFRPNGQVVTNETEMLRYGRRDENIITPNYNPATQRLQAIVGEDGKLEFSILELENMDAKMHEEVIGTMLSKHRRDDYVNAMEKKAVYKIGSYEVDAAQVENERVNKILDEMREEGVIGKEDGFAQLSDDNKTKVLALSAKRLNEARDDIESARKAKLIREGTYEQEMQKFDLVKVQLPRSVPSVPSIVDNFLTSYGDEIASDTERRKAYSFGYNKLSVLHRSLSPSDHKMLYNLLVGFRKGESTIQQMYQSLLDKKIPLGVFSILNAKCTIAVNEWIAYIMGIQDIQLANFMDDINDLSSWLVTQVQNGALKNDAIDKLNQYVSQSVGTIVDYPRDLIEGRLDHITNEIGIEQVILSEESGNITYLPYTAAEVGLNTNGATGYNLLPLKESPMYSTLFSTDIKLHPHDYIVTLDKFYFRIVGRVDDGVVVRHVHL